MNSNCVLWYYSEEIVGILLGYCGHLLGICVCSILRASAALGDFDDSFCILGRIHDSTMANLRSEI